MMNMDKHSFNLFSVLCTLTITLSIWCFKYNDWIDTDKNISYRRSKIKWYDQHTHSYATMQTVNISERKEFPSDSTTMLYSRYFKYVSRTTLIYSHAILYFQ